MRAVTFYSVLMGTATRIGIDPTAALNSNEARALAEYLTDASRVCWEFYPWPETIIAEQRTAATQIIGYQQAGEKVIGEVMSVSTRNPETNTNPGFIAFGLNADGVIVPAAQTDPVWVRFRKPSPEFTAVNYDNAAAYIVNDLVYYPTTKNCYKCIDAATGDSPTDTAHWEIQEIPRILDRALREGAYSLFMREEGQHSTSMLPNAAMEALLIQQVDLIQRQQGQAGYFNVVPYPAHINSYH